MTCEAVLLDELNEEQRHIVLEGLWVQEGRPWFVFHGFLLATCREQLAFHGRLCVSVPWEAREGECVQREVTLKDWGLVNEWIGRKLVDGLRENEPTHEGANWPLETNLTHLRGDVHEAYLHGLWAETGGLWSRRAEYLLARAGETSAEYNAMQGWLCDRLASDLRASKPFDSAAHWECAGFAELPESHLAEFAEKLWCLSEHLYVERVNYLTKESEDRVDPDGRQGLPDADKEYNVLVHHLAVQMLKTLEDSKPKGWHRAAKSKAVRKRHWPPVGLEALCESAWLRLAEELCQLSTLYNTLHMRRDLNNEGELIVLRIGYLWALRNHSRRVGHVKVLPDGSPTAVPRATVQMLLDEYAHLRRALETLRRRNAAVEIVALAVDELQAAWGGDAQQTRASADGSEAGQAEVGEGGTERDHALPETGMKLAEGGQEGPGRLSVPVDATNPRYVWSHESLADGKGYYHIVFGDEEGTISASEGTRTMALLLARPNTQLRALALVQELSPPDPDTLKLLTEIQAANRLGAQEKLVARIATVHVDEMLDPRTMRVLGDCREEINELLSSDTITLQRREELEELGKALEEKLSPCIGPEGRSRHFLTDASKAADTVAKRLLDLRRTLNKAGLVKLEEHINGSVDRRNHCFLYSPGPNIVWTFGD